MRHFACALSLLLLTALCRAPLARAADAKADLPSVTLAPTTVKVATILAAHRKATGTRQSGLSDHSVEDWAFTLQGAPATEHLDRFGTDYYSKIVFGPFVTEFGQSGDVRWKRDANGYPTKRTADDPFSFAAQRVLADADNPKYDVSVAGVTTDKAPAYVLRVSRPPNKHPEWVFYDVGTGLITRVEANDGWHRQVSTFDDYRQTAGFTSPWHVHDSNGLAQFDSDYHRTSLAYGGAANAIAYALPSARGTIEDVTVGGGKLPVHWTRFGPIVRITVQGRGLDFLLSPSSGESVIDHDVAAELGLPTFGQVTDYRGFPTSYLTMIDDATSGPLELHHLALLAQVYHYEPDSDTKVVGVLGYDFLAGNVFRIDNANETVDVTTAATFNAGAAIADKFNMPVTLDSGSPYVNMGLGGDMSDHVLFDDTFPITMVFSRFYDAHSSDFVDECAKCGHGVAILPFADGEAFGTRFELWRSTIQHMRLANTDFDKIPVYATNTATFYHRDVDAILGANVLRYFDIYFDYPDGQIVLAKNANFYKVFTAK